MSAWPLLSRGRDLHVGNVMTFYILPVNVGCEESRGDISVNVFYANNSDNLQVSLLVGKGGRYLEPFFFKSCLCIQGGILKAA